MTRSPFLLCLFVLCMSGMQAQRPTHKSLSEQWIVTQDFLGTPRYMRLELHENAGKLTGKLNRDSLEGTLQGETIRFVARSEHNNQFDVSGNLRGDLISATMIATEGGHSQTTYSFALTARPVQPLQHKTPVRHDFQPTVFYRQFSAANAPVLIVAPGDTIHTATVDAGGTDAHNVRRAAGGNPQTGPFYVSGAMPGDVLVVHINKLRLNRDWALSDDEIVGRGQNRDMSLRMKEGGKETRWHLDLANGTAAPESPSSGLAHFHIPLQPMLGCVATAWASRKPLLEPATPGTSEETWTLMRLAKAQPFTSV